MSYRGAALVQKAIHARLTATLPDVAVVDAVPPGAMPKTYVLIGAEEVRDASDKTGRGAEHRVTVSVVSGATGFLAAKEMAARVTVALEDAPFAAGAVRVVSARFLRAAARRIDGGALRRVDMTFRLRVEL